MSVLIGNGIAVLLVAGAVGLALRSIRKSHKSGSCAGCSGCSCSGTCPHCRQT